MLMEWTDLIVGDIIRFTDEAFRRFGGYEWAVRDNIVLTEVETLNMSSAGENIRFWFRDHLGDRYIFTDHNGQFQGITMFEIVELAGE